MKLLVYSAVFGGYDSVSKPLFCEEGVDYHLFTDVDVISGSGWDKVTITDPSDNPRREARLIKTRMPLMAEAEGYDATLWMDGSMTPQGPVLSLVMGLLHRHHFAAFSHPERQCVYEETRKIEALKKDTEGRMLRARHELANAMVPENYGLAATGILARRQSEVVKEHAELWAAAIDAVSVRDQVTFGWIAHDVTGSKSFEDWLRVIPGNVFNNPLFSRAAHTK
jgi:hypothetical protein